MVALIHTVQAAGSTEAFASVVNPIMEHIVSPLIMLMFAVAAVVFVWGVIEMIMNGEDASAREKGKNHVLAGSIGLAIMLSAWGIMYLISNTISSLK